MIEQNERKLRLLEDEKNQAILDYLLMCGKGGAKFSEILRYTGFKSRSLLHYKLTQLKKEKIVLQHGPKQPYFLSEKFYNRVLHNILVKNIKNMPVNAMFILSPNIAFYGIYPELLDERDKKSLFQAFEELQQTLRNIKLKQIRKEIRKFYENELRKMIDIKQTDRKLLLSLLEYLLHFSVSLYFQFGQHVSLQQIKSYMKRANIMGIKNKNVGELIANLSYILIHNYKIFPSEVGFCLYNPYLPYFYYSPKIGKGKEDTELDIEKLGILMPYYGKILKPYERKYLDISIYSDWRDFDYVLYIKTEREFALKDRYFSMKNEEEVKYWEKENKRIEKILNKKQREYYNKLLAKWIKSRFIYDLRHIPDLMERGSPINQFFMEELRYWIKRYKALGYSLSIRDVIEENEKKGIKLTCEQINKIKQFLREYC